MNSMRHHKLLLAILFWFIPLALSAQRTISGRITDASDGNAISGASVFFSNTTVGTTTDDEGKYQLKIPGEGSYRLTVSHVGYQPVFMDIDPGKTQIALDIAMYAPEMEEVTITTKPSVRNKDIDLFWKTILGKKPSKKTIQAMNPEAVYYYYNPETDKLTVTCRVPLQIVNHETGYHIQFVLNYFVADYGVDNISWEGEYMFTELEPDHDGQMKTWEISRKKIYRTTIGNFIKALYHDNTLEEGFLFVNIQEHHTPAETKTVENKLVFSDGKLYQTYNNATHVTSHQYDLIDPDYFIVTDSVTGDKSFRISPHQDVMMISFGRPVTQRDLEKAKSQVSWGKIGSYRNNISTPASRVLIYPDGSYQNPIRLTPMFNSYSLSGLNMMLPLDYYPGGETEMNAFAENRPDEAPETSPPATSLTRVGKRFDEQLNVFPQEKIYIQTDKPYYITGERIWLRAHVVDAATHIPALLSGSVFVELFDVRDSVVSRIKTGIGNDLYGGYIDIPEDTPEGDYIIRAYTAAMRDLDEDYFFMKTVRIGDPMSRIMQVHPEFQFLSDKRIGADFRFSHIRPAGPVTPESLKITINSGKSVSLKSADGKSGFSFNLASDAKQRVMLLDAMYDRNPFRQYVRIPFPDDDFDVSFY
ncbi:MAG: carboxypeptidase-like regulatory domain-containing protein, partial [Bacteroidales bacterium]|nr:carboxypeptidase-like regulatory domain-containing protein [Bacteroidales bacterium]